MAVTALGMIETIGLVSAIEAADAGTKAADVRLLGTDYVRGGLVMVRFEGEVAAVKAAVDAGTDAAQRVGKVLSAHVIPRAMPEVFCMLASDPSVGPGKRHQGGCASCGGCEGGRRELAAICAAAKAPTPAEEPAAPAAAPAKETAEEPALQPESNSPVPVTGSAAVPTLAELKEWKVVALRSYVRKLDGFPMTPNEIRYANKARLLDALEQYLKTNTK